jgi:hypothetical protein
MSDMIPRLVSLSAERLELTQLVASRRKPPGPTIRRGSAPDVHNSCKIVTGSSSDCRSGGTLPSLELGSPRLEAVGDCPIAGCDLDVGCGREGNLEVINEYSDRARVTGLLSSVRFGDEVAARALKWMRSSFRSRRVALTCLRRSDPRIPIRHQAVSLPKCFACSALADISHMPPVATGGTHRERWLAIGLELERDRDITANVLLSCDRLFGRGSRSSRAETMRALRRSSWRCRVPAVTTIGG